MTTPDEIQKEIDALTPEPPKEAPKKDPREGMGAGIQLAVSIFVCAWIGYSVDKALDSQPAFLIVGLLLGISTGFYSVYKASKGL